MYLISTMNKIFFYFFIFNIIFLDLMALENFSSSVIENIKQKYGEKSYNTLVAWDNMIIKAKNEKTIMKLKLVNDFFNNVKYMIDIEHWKVLDYWATPMEFLGTRNGDCEDYAIAKYFALIQVGIPKEKLRISYVKLLNKRTQYEEAHMVLAYFNQPNSIPIILDNINQQLELASKRDDLKLIYSFNADGLWDAKNIGKEEKKENENNLYQWKTMMSKF